MLLLLWAFLGTTFLTLFPYLKSIAILLTHRVRGSLPRWFISQKGNRRGQVSYFGMCRMVMEQGCSSGREQPSLLNWAARAAHPKALLFVLTQTLFSCWRKQTLVTDAPCKRKCRVKQEENSVEFILGRGQVHCLGCLNPPLDEGNMLCLKWYLYLQDEICFP